MSKQSILGLLVLVLSSCSPAVDQETAQQATAEQKAGDVQAIIAQEKRALDQWSSGNPSGYMSAESSEPDVTYFDDIGAQNRIDGIEAMGSYLASLKGKIPPHKYEVVNPKVQLYGDVGVLTLQYQGYGPEGQKLTLWKATSVYHRSGNGWRSVHAHWSTVKG